MLLHVIAGRHAVVFTEDGGEGGAVGETAGVHHLGDVHTLLGEELGSLLQADATDEVVGCLTCEFLHLTMEVDATDADLVGDHVDIEVGVRKVLTDALHDLLKQFIVGRLEADVLDTLFEAVGTLVLHLQESARTEQIEDSASQDIHIERLDDVSVGTCLQSFETVFVAIAGREQDDGYEVRRGVRLQLRAEGVTIHLGHHHVADDEAGFDTVGLRESLAAVATGMYVVVLGEF